MQATREETMNLSDAIAAQDSIMKTGQCLFIVPKLFRLFHSNAGLTHEDLMETYSLIGEKVKPLVKSIIN